MVLEERKLRFRFAQNLIKTAGALALDYFNNRETLQIEHKGLQDVVSIADQAVEQLIRDDIRAAFANDGFLGEENAEADIAQFEQKSTHVIWVVDPIDGTALFLNGIPSWCVSIALIVDGEIELGLIYDPCNDELFSAQRGQGALLNGKAIHITAAKSVAQGMTGVGFSHRVAPSTVINFLEPLLNDGGMYVRSGSGALSLAYVAAGRLIGYYEPHINAWDCLAGILLVEEAGGTVNNFLENDGLAKGNAILCGSQPVYSHLQQYLPTK